MISKNQAMELYKSKYSEKKSKRNSNRDKKPSRSFRNSRDDRGSRFSRDDRRRESATVTCADCGTECEVPFVPKTDRPVYCSDCFRQNKPSGLDNDRDSGFSRNERSSRSSFEEPKRRDSRSKKLKNDKFLKKQESFYSQGSEKFYNSLKDKLFEILGGKICSSCGFRDERALGFSHLYDDEAFDSIRRGGFASSWGKYISEPDLAREELKVLCLNCNEIREPASKPKEERSKPKRKKSRYFPR